MKKTKGGDQASSLIAALKSLAQRPEQQVTYFIMLEGAPMLGPIERSQFIDFVRKHALPPHTKIRANGERDFVPFHQHPHFKREKKIPPPFKKGDGHFYYLENGRRQGPFKREKIQQLLNSKELLTTDLLSSDAGATWHKAFEFEEFDRRLQSGNLPQTRPQEYNFPSTDIRPDWPRDESGERQKKREQDAMAILNFFGALDPTDGHKGGEEGPGQEESPPPSPPRWKLGLFSVLALTCAYWWWPPSHTPETVQSEKREMAPAKRAPASAKALQNKAAPAAKPKAAAKKASPRPKIVPRPAPKPKPRKIAKPPPRPKARTFKKKRPRPPSRRKAKLTRPPRRDTWPPGEEERDDEGLADEELDDDYGAVEETGEEELERELLENLEEDDADGEDLEDEYD